MIREWLIVKLGGELPWDYDDDYEDEEVGYRFRYRILDRFRRKQAVISNRTDDRIVDMDSAITMLDPDVSQFQTMLWAMQNRRLDSLGVINNAISWLEDEAFPRLTAITFDAPWGDWGWTDLIEVVPLTLANTDALRRGDLVRLGDEALRYDGRRLWRFEVLK